MLKQQLSQEFNMKDLEIAKKILGMEFVRNKKRGELRLFQSQCIEKVLTRFGKERAKLVATTLGMHFMLLTKLSPGTTENKEHMSHVPYASVVGSLMYAMVYTRPDIAHVVSVHVPRINGEIPSVDEATSDHQRLLDRLQLYDLVELKIQGDGNCQFRALSDQFYHTPEHHKFVRQQVINQLKSCSECYEGYVPMAYTEYLKKMSKSGEWGDHVTLQAAADSYGVKIFVLTSFKDTCYIEILPTKQRSERVIFLSFWAEVHYNSIYPEGDQPISENKKKRWRGF